LNELHLAHTLDGGERIEVEVDRDPTVIERCNDDVDRERNKVETPQARKNGEESISPNPSPDLPRVDGRQFYDSQPQDAGKTIVSAMAEVTVEVPATPGSDPRTPEDLVCEAESALPPPESSSTAGAASNLARS
jgi:hypothetical protein